MQSQFGWVLSGSCTSSTKSKSHSSLLCISKVSESDLKNFWDLETVGIMEKQTDNLKTNPIMIKFQKELEFVNKRYQVPIVWKSESDKQNVINNFPITLKRLNNLYNYYR